METTEQNITHNPGPWAVEIHNEWEGKTILVNQVFPEGHAFRGTTIQPLCSVRPTFEPSIGEGNARLIAAAPDLLKALKAIRDSSQFRNRLENSVQQTVHTAIAKAEGR